jgi:membrane protein implicated in regulation of membrane protease activity
LEELFQFQEGGSAVLILSYYLPYLWLAIAVVAAIIEGCTTQLVSIWFAIGGVAAAISAFCGVPPWLQLLIFIGVTVLTLLLTRPFVHKAMNFKKTDTNADRYIGMKGIVTQQIDNTAGTGLVKVQGSLWTARSYDGEVIPEGADVLVKTIEGVKLLVKEITKPE